LGWTKRKKIRSGRPTKEGNLKGRGENSPVLFLRKGKRGRGLSGGRGDTFALKQSRRGRKKGGLVLFGNHRGRRSKTRHRRGWRKEKRKRSGPFYSRRKKTGKNGKVNRESFREREGKRRRRRKKGCHASTCFAVLEERGVSYATRGIAK